MGDWHPRTEGFGRYTENEQASAAGWQPSAAGVDPYPPGEQGCTAGSLIRTGGERVCSEGDRAVLAAKATLSAGFVAAL